MRHRRRYGFLRWIALGFAVAALLVPTAQAKYQTEGGGVTSDVGSATTTQANSSEFNWSGAIAGVGIGIVLLASGVVVLQRRRGRLVGA